MRSLAWYSFVFTVTCVAGAGLALVLVSNAIGTVWEHATTPRAPARLSVPPRARLHPYEIN